jgi:hypothetical protein
MSNRLIDRIPFTKILTVLASVFGISLGLCGLTAISPSGGGGFLIAMGTLELAAMVLSAVGLIIVALVYVTLSIFGGSEEKVSQSVIPREQQDDKRNDKSE